MLRPLPRVCLWWPAPGSKAMTHSRIAGSAVAGGDKDAEKTGGVNRPWGLRDEDFEQRRPLRGQITKREIRAVSLYSLALRPDGVVWDIGAGTGSISVEAAMICSQGRVYAVERDVESIPLLEQNATLHSPGNVEIVAGAAPEVLEKLPDPDSVFIGGSGGNLNEILATVAGRLKTGGRVVANFATLERTNETYRWLQQQGFQVDVNLINAARSRPMPDGSMRLEALNPVFVVSARRQGQSPEDWADE